MEAWVNGVSTRNVDDLVVALGGTGISKSEVSRICQGLDEEVSRFRTRRLDATSYPYVFLDATYLHVRSGGLVSSKAVVVATGVTAEGRREILGLDVGDSEDEVFWRTFLTHLKSRGLTGVQLVISDQHAGLVAAIGRCFQGAGHQRCRVHFARNLLAMVPKNQMDMAAALFRTIFAQPDADTVAATWEQVRDQLAARIPKIGPYMDDAKTEVLAFAGFPRVHWRKIWSTNPLVSLSRLVAPSDARSALRHVSSINECGIGRSHPAVVLPTFIAPAASCGTVGLVGGSSEPAPCRGTPRGTPYRCSAASVGR